MAIKDTQLKKDYAKRLYVEGYTQKAIAEIVGVTEKTIGKWKEKYNWDHHKKGYLITKETQIQEWQDQIDELNTAIRCRPEGERYASSKEADIIGKLSKAIQNLEKEVAIEDKVNAFIDLIKFVRVKDYKKAQMIADEANKYILNL